MTRRLISDLMTQSGVKFGTSGARGLVAQMTDEVCYGYAAAFVATVAGAAREIVLGHDLRPSSPRIAAACAAAIEDAGLRVRYAGALPTPALAYHAQCIGAPALIVTGSHIPFDRNGIKFYRADGEITKDDERRMGAAEVDVPPAVRLAPLGEPDPAARAAYVDRYVDYFGAGAFAGFRVAVYEHSSVARDVLGELLGSLGIEVVALGRTDVFVPIDTEAVRPEDVEQARRWAREHRFDAIVSTDGDADRPLIGDERGEWLRGDAVGVLCARYLRVDVAVTPVSSNTAAERCGAFDRVVRTRIGSPYVIAGMAAAVAPDTTVAGYEANGGFLLGTPIARGDRRLAALPTRDAVLPMLAVLSAARDSGLPLSALTATLPPRFTASDRLQDFASERSGALIDRLAGDEALAATVLAPDSGHVAHIDRTDGLRVAFANGDIVHLRASGNAPELRCYAESETVDGAKQLCDDCLARIREGRTEAAAATHDDEWPSTATGGEWR